MNIIFVMKFYNRIRELNILENKFASSKFEMVLVYGRRRIGKTYLLRYFVRNKRHVFYVANQQTANVQFPRFYGEVSQKILGYKLSFGTLDDFFEWFTSQIAISDDKMILIIDEFQYLVGIYPAFPSVLKTWIENRWIDMDFMLIICGSAIGMMLDLIDISQPLYGMITGKLEIQQFTFLDLLHMFSDLDISTALQVFGIFGGSPAYLIYYDTSQSLWQNIRWTIINYGHKLFDEPRNLLQSELPNNAIYFNIMYAIATGRNKQSEIANLLGINARNLPLYMSRLERLKLIRKIIPIVSKSRSKNTKYVIVDPFFKFWFKFTFPNSSAIESEDFDYLKQLFDNEINMYMGQIMEIVVVQLIKLLNAKKLLPFKANPNRIGNWWNKGKTTIEIDCLALDRYNPPRRALFIESKWGKGVDAEQILKKLITKVDSTEFAMVPERWYAVIARDFIDREHPAAISISVLVNSYKQNVHLQFYTP